MVKTYLDILSERGIRPFLTDEAFEELQKFDYKSQYAIPGQVMPVFKHPNQHKIELGKTTNLIGDMCWYGPSSMAWWCSTRTNAIWTGRRPPRTSVFRSFSRNTAGSAASPS